MFGSAPAWPWRLFPQAYTTGAVSADAGDGIARPPAKTPAATVVAAATLSRIMKPPVIRSVPIPPSRPVPPGHVEDAEGTQPVLIHDGRRCGHASGPGHRPRAR